MWLSYTQHPDGLTTTYSLKVTSLKQLPLRKLQAEYTSSKKWGASDFLESSPWVNWRSQPLNDVFQHMNSNKCNEIRSYTHEVIHWLCKNTVLMKSWRILLLAR